MRWDYPMQPLSFFDSLYWARKSAELLNMGCSIASSWEDSIYYRVYKLGPRLGGFAFGWRKWRVT
jgi:hypothetical protein